MLLLLISDRLLLSDLGHEAARHDVETLDAAVSLLGGRGAGLRVHIALRARLLRTSLAMLGRGLRDTVPDARLPAEATAHGTRLLLRRRAVVAAGDLGQVVAIKRLLAVVALQLLHEAAGRLEVCRAALADLRLRGVEQPLLPVGGPVLDAAGQWGNLLL